MALPFLIISKDQDNNPALAMDLKDFVPLQNVDKNFDYDVRGEQIFARKGDDS